MISSTLLTLIVIPAIFGLVKGFRLPPDDLGRPRRLAIEKPTPVKRRIAEPAE
jgi:Cu(I)/Ag(I) efflux system membrane protein CusA/SilA